MDAPAAQASPRLSLCRSKPGPGACTPQPWKLSFEARWRPRGHSGQSLRCQPPRAQTPNAAAKEPTRHPPQERECCLCASLITSPPPLPPSLSSTTTGTLASRRGNTTSSTHVMANLPPTPQPSTDITGKSSANAPQLDAGFALPPAAMSGRSRKSSSSAASETASDSSYRPPSPASPVATFKTGNGRKRSSAASQQGVVTKEDYSLPPPPTRRAKIIQMKPKDVQEPPKSDPQTQSAKAATATASGSKKKQASTTTAAGRKMARKTAHSLIERRRRSKMNEEFGVLKDMIPACRGEEMHKLAILQVRSFCPTMTRCSLTAHRHPSSTCGTWNNASPTSRRQTSHVAALPPRYHQTSLYLPQPGLSSTTTMRTTTTTTTRMGGPRTMRWRM